MRAYERFIEYVKIYTTSNPANEGTQPSTARQFDLAHLLVQQMQQLGIADARVDDKCYVYGSIPATPGYESAPAIGLIAHMDTAPDAEGQGVQPLLHPNYNGEDVHLPNGRVIDVKTFPALAGMKGQTLITASGDTLLGADDKAGVAEIITVCEQLLCGEMPHGRVCIAFTPDEEIGAGAAGFDVAGFGAQYAYTVDGGDAGEIEYETFNAAHASVFFTGVGVHPGSAKGIMVNAARLAAKLDAMLPGREAPEYTEGREGFYHLVHIEGNVEHAVSEYILRDHSAQAFAARKQTIQQAVEEIQREHGPQSARITLRDEYRNMKEIIEQNYHLVENAREAIRKAGLSPITYPVRGGTDGSQLSFMGLPCPNLGTGGFYFHGPNECITAEKMDKAVEIVLNILDIYARTTQV